jgi:protein-arginine kinase activator protein McsA
LKPKTNQAALPVDFFIKAVASAGVLSADTVIGKFDGAEPEMSGFIARRKTLRMELDQAVAAEEYEGAAELRDVLALLDKEGKNGQ